MSAWKKTSEEVPSHDEPVAIRPRHLGHQFAVWNKHEECWDDESGDDYMCDKDAVEEWFEIPWND